MENGKLFGFVGRLKEAAVVRLNRGTITFNDTPKTQPEMKPAFVVEQAELPAQLPVENDERSRKLAEAQALTAELLAMNDTDLDPLSSDTVTEVEGDLLNPLNYKKPAARITGCRDLMRFDMSELNQMLHGTMPIPGRK